MSSGSRLGSSTSAAIPIAATPSTSAWCTFIKQRPAATVEALDQGRLPQRPGAVEPVRELAPDERAEFRLAARSREARLPDVPVEVEPAVVDPQRVGESPSAGSSIRWRSRGMR